MEDCRLVSADFTGELANLEAVHLELERAERNAKRLGGGGHVPAALLQRPDDEVALEGGNRQIQQVLRSWRVRVELRDVELVGKILVGNPVLVGNGHQPLNQVLELTDVSGPPVGAQDLHG